MDPNFWHRRWATNDIGWHENAGNTLLIEHFNTLSISPLGRVFVPLCGKTRDIGWLLGQGYSVVAIELNKMAVDALFTQLRIVPKITIKGPLTRYRAANIDVFIGDFFAFTVEQLGVVDAIFDRASFVALPYDMRIKYTRHLTDVTGNAKQLLIVFEYDQNQMKGPPFSISHDEINRHYQGIYNASLLSSIDVSGQLRGDFTAQENAYILQPLD